MADFNSLINIFVFFLMCFIKHSQCDEPVCSRFLYEEKIMEKMIRVEVKTETLASEIKETQHEVMDEATRAREQYAKQLQEIRREKETMKSEFKSLKEELEKYIKLKSDEMKALANKHKCKEICPDGWTVFNGSCYYISDNTSVDWIEATNHCALHGAHLVIIESKEEDLFIKNELDRMYRTRGQRPGQEFWIGTSDEVVEGIWVWYKGDQPLGYTHWFPGQPGSDGKDEDCAVIASRGGEFNGWHDAPCSARHYPICEIGSTL